MGRIKSQNIRILKATEWRAVTPLSRMCRLKIS